MEIILANNFCLDIYEIYLALFYTLFQIKEFNDFAKYKIIISKAYSHTDTKKAYIYKEMHVSHTHTLK